MSLKILTELNRKSQVYLICTCLYCQTNVTSFVLGAEEGPLLATTAKDFDNKLQGVPVKAAPSQSTSIAVSKLPLIVYVLKICMTCSLFNLLESELILSLFD